MNNLTITGDRKSILDNELVITSLTIPDRRVFSVDTTNNVVIINKNAATLPLAPSNLSLDVSGSVNIASTLNIQGTKFNVSALGYVGVNTLPTQQFHVVGDVIISGNVQAFGASTSITTTSFETTDANLLLNAGGNDTTASSSGISIYRDATTTVSNGITNTIGLGSGSGTGLVYAYQFIPSNPIVSAIATQSLSRSTSGTGSLYAVIFTSNNTTNTPATQVAYSTNTIAYNDLPTHINATTQYAPTTFTFDNVTLNVGTRYFINIYRSTPIGTSVVISGSNITNTIYSWDGGATGTDLYDISLAVSYRLQPDPAQILWDNARSNFRAGLSSNLTSFALIGGNTEGNNLVIGTADNYTLNLETNNITRISITQNGDVSFAGNLDITGSFSLQGIPVEYSGVPLGAIVSFIPGVFSSSSNTGFSTILGTANTPASVNAWLQANGYDHWRVCDGASYVFANSPLYNGSNRFTPNLTDSRFLMGSTAAGSLGGTNDRTHTHTMNTVGNVNLAHSHSMTTNTIPHSDLSFPVDTTIFNSDISTNPVTSTLSSTGSISHSHDMYHTHGPGDMWSRAFVDGPYITIQARGTPYWVATRNQYTWGTLYSTPGWAIPYGPGYCWGAVMTGSSTNMWPSSGMPSNTLTIPFTHCHATGAHIHDARHTHTSTAAHRHSTGCHGHNDAGTTWSTGTFNTQFDHTHTTTSTSMTENRPQYLTCFYLVRVL